jgi:hypothetical protein
MKSIDTDYYVLPEGTTQEELVAWDTIEEMCRTGQFTPDTRIFFPDKNGWVRAGDTDLRSLFKDAGRNEEKPIEEPEDVEGSELEAEYREAVRRINESPEDADPVVEAGRLAAEMGDRNAAREHFQTALRLKPFNSRIAQEVMRRFNKTECTDFLYLRREPSAWDEPADLLSYPLTAGLHYLAIPAAALFVLLLVPFGLYLAGPLSFLWCVKLGRHTAAGLKHAPSWKTALANPSREIILPLAAAAAVVGEYVLVVYGVGRVSMMLSGEEGSAFRYIAESPVLSVTLTLIALAYLPAVFVRITHSVGIIVDLMSPWIVIRAMIRMGQEYAISVLLVLVLFFVLFGLNYVIGGVPVVGKALLAAVSAYAIPMIGFTLGRLAGRMQHVL